MNKRQWWEHELLALLGDRFELFGKPNPCGEVRRGRHKDGAIGAKREYCFSFKEESGSAG